MALAGRCAPNVPAQTLAAVARTESGFDPWALHDNTTGVSEAPASAQAALADARAWLRQGDSVDIGLMQINSANLPALGMTARTALDPCASLAGGAAVLQAAYGGGTTNADNQVALLEALSRYNTGSPLKGIMNGYARTVMANADSAALPASIGSKPRTPPADPNAPPSWDISATGAYAQSHGAAWLISRTIVKPERHADRERPTPISNPRNSEVSMISKLIGAINEPKKHNLAMQRIAVALALLGAPTLAYAQTVTGGASPQTMINNVCTFILGPFGETIAVLGIIGIGFLFMFGRASLGVIAGIIGGIVIMFGASYLGQTLTGGGG